MRDLKELTNMVEKLCKKGQAYRAKRMRAGEKSSAYLSGRAVKVCKGQMQGENADPDGDDITIDPDTNFKLDLKHLLKKHIVDDGEDIEEIDALHEDEEYCPKCADKLRESIRKELDECWKSYKQVGMKKKGNKMVPNCVPKNEEVDENLRNWFKKEKWKRIDTQGNIAGDCGTMPKGKKTQRCLPQAKAQSLTKKQRAATSRKKTASNKQFVKNTKVAKVKK